MTAPPRVPGVRNRLAYAEGLLLDEQLAPGSIAARHARLGEPHVAELNRWAEDVAAVQRRRVPFVDPGSGGAAHRCSCCSRTPPRWPRTDPG